MKWPEQKTRWSLVTRTLYRSAIRIFGGKRDVHGQFQSILSHKDEQASSHQIGGRAGIALVAAAAQPSIIVRESSLSFRPLGPAGGQDLLRAPAGLGGFSLSEFSLNQRVTMPGKQIEMAINDAALNGMRSLNALLQGREPFGKHFRESIHVLAGNEIAL